MLMEVNRFWWLFLLRGILSILFGIFALLSPGLTAVTLITVFGIYAIFDGGMAIGVALFGGSGTPNRFLHALEGILGVIFGVLILTWPGISLIVLLEVIAVWALVTGIAEIALAFPARNLWLGLAGVASVLFGLFAFRFPGEGALALVTIIGFYAIIFGVLFVILAFEVRRYKGVTAAARA